MPVRRGARQQRRCADRRFRLCRWVREGGGGALWCGMQIPDVSAQSLCILKPFATLRTLELFLWFSWIPLCRHFLPENQIQCSPCGIELTRIRIQERVFGS